MHHASGASERGSYNAVVLPGAPRGGLRAFRPELFGLAGHVLGRAVQQSQEHAVEEFCTHFWRPQSIRAV